MTNRDPDMLLDEVGRSIMVKALIVSAVAHAVIIFATSFGLYADWAEFGVHSPSKINLLKKDRDEKAAVEAKRKSVEEERSAGATNTPVATVPASGAEPAAKTGGAAPAHPELEPLPPKSEFKLGEDFNL